MIGKTFDKLTVINYDEEKEIAKVRCECGSIETRKRRQLIYGRVLACQECKEREKYLKSLDEGAKRLASMEPDIRRRIVASFARHIEICRKNKTPATGLATFITESLADPDFGKEQEMDQSFEARFLRSNPQRYRVYDKPSELI